MRRAGAGASHHAERVGFLGTIPRKRPVFHGSGTGVKRTDPGKSRTRAVLCHHGRYRPSSVRVTGRKENADGKTGKSYIYRCCKERGTGPGSRSLLTRTFMAFSAKSPYLSRTRNRSAAAIQTTRSARPYSWNTWSQGLMRRMKFSVNDRDMPLFMREF